MVIYYIKAMLEATMSVQTKICALFSNEEFIFEDLREF